MNEYNEQTKLHFANEDEDDTPTSSIFLTTTHTPEPPTRPNELIPYSADIFGLDKARRDCLSEMLKIVREVGCLFVDTQSYIVLNIPRCPGRNCCY